MSGIAGGQAQYQPKSEKTPTLNERLNKASEGIQYQCERLETVLARALGHPTAQNKISGALTTSSPTLPLSVVIEHFESILARLQNIATEAEQIA